MNKTVLADFLAPAITALGKVRHNPQRFKSLPMPAFILAGCLRHLQGMKTLREQIQQLFHLTDADCVPVARSPYSDALSSEPRKTILEQALAKLVPQARTQLPDRLQQLNGLQGRAVYATDGSYQSESAHYRRCTPKQGGGDNPKGHMMLAFYDVRLGAPVDVRVETQNRHEMLVFKDYSKESYSLLRQRKALWVVDRAFVDMPFWDAQKRRYRQTVITRWKENLVIEDSTVKSFDETIINEGVYDDEEVTLKASSERWRLISYQSPEGTYFQFLTNEMDLESGVIAFLYLRRWDEEKCYDTWKNDFASDKAWSKRHTGITQQALLAIMTSLLLLLFAHHHQGHWKIVDEKSLKKQDARIDQRYVRHEQRIPWHIFSYRAVSKISRQIIRFLKHCFLKKSSSGLYERQLKPLLLRYL
ncbi:transposase [Microbulbifer sp. 2205BS26-8]|uniref:transposase n=1 Tax=Microbulbifer sp. 2205BS26-8 TaxID=3064386 RepID=UPI00273E6998|nr:transposase [Microbulbifer sp. 2205BS26-8]MDP5210906.1 transposase [Microbulbifer sp. 2205BS26-8]